MAQQEQKMEIVHSTADNADLSNSDEREFINISQQNCSFSKYSYNGEESNENIDSLESDSQDGEDYFSNYVIDYKSLIRYICPECGLDCGSYLYWQSHTEKQHLFDTIAWLNISSVTNLDGESYYQCLDCNEKLSRKMRFRHLQNHRIKHLPHRNYLNCIFCDVKYQEVTVMMSHIKKSHAKPARQCMKGKKSNPYMKYIKMSCPFCEQTQTIIKLWWQHLIEKHDYENIIKLHSIKLNRVYSCKLCKQEICEKSLKNHMLVHLQNKSFVCAFCEKSETNQNTAIQHVGRKHFCAGSKLLECRHCDAIFANESLLEDHFRNRHENKILKCTVCNKEFINASKLFLHMNTTNHFSELNQSYKSLSMEEEEAKISFSSNSTDVPPKITNGLAAYNTLNIEQLEQKEIKTEHPVTDVGESLFNFTNLVMQHVANKEICLPRDDSRKEVEEITLDLVDSDSLDEQDDRQDTVTYSKFIQYICPECGVDCGPFSKWKEHTENEHMSNTFAWLNLSSKTSPDGVSYYQCMDCNKVLSHLMEFRELRAHRIEHLPHKLLRCGFCDIRFEATTSLYQHINEFHAEPARQCMKRKSSNPYMKYIKILCPFCQQPQTNIMLWWQHLIEKHDYENIIKLNTIKLNKSVYSCKMCKQEICERTLRNHMLVHLENKSFVCTLCAKYETNQSTAMQHVVRKHFCNDIKLLKCRHCDATFAKKSLLGDHYRNCHEIKMLKCAVCNMEFLDSSKLFLHMNTTNHFSEFNQSHENLSMEQDQAIVEAKISFSSYSTDVQPKITNVLAAYNTLSRVEPEQQGTDIESMIMQNVVNKEICNLRDDSAKELKQHEIKIESNIGESLFNSTKKESMIMQHAANKEVCLPRGDSRKEVDEITIDLIDSDSLDEQDDMQVTSINYSKCIQYICPECGVNCGPFSKWKTHTEKEHMSNTFTWLNLSFKTSADNESYYQCMDCNKVLSYHLDFRELREHRMEHLPHKLLKCCFCDTRFQATTSLYEHINEFHATLAHQKSRSLRMKYVKIICPICQQSQSDIKNWWQHLKNIHDYENIMKSKATKLNKYMYSCHLCKQLFRQRSLRPHMMMHEKHKPFLCTLCGKSETQLSTAILHVSRNHPSNV